MIAGIAIVLLVIGGGVVLLVGKKEPRGAGPASECERHRTLTTQQCVTAR